MRGYLEIEERVVFGVGQALSRVVINYNEKGQRTEIYYGNNTRTKYTYDPNTFRLINLLTTRISDTNNPLQDISYTYDPVGNITQITDDAQRTHYFNNSVIAPTATYTYDALYRLKTATGRELTSLQLPTHTDFVNNIPTPNTSANAIQNYTQQFQYDELGNIEQMKSVGNWTRDYHYDFANERNYLLGHTNGSTEYTYDKHGNTLSMPHLSSMLWDDKDQLKEVTLNASGDKAYYVYDASGERVRKVIEKTGGIIEERVYLGGFEVFRKTVSGTLQFERETLHISDDTKKIAGIETKTVENGSTISSPVFNIRYQYDNHLGSASLELDDTAAIISYEEYHPFGTTSYRSGRTETEVSLKMYKYVGKERDDETGLYYYGARYYAAWLARFVSCDPLNDEYIWQTPYAYHRNSPITSIDFNGMGDPPYQINQVYFAEITNPKVSIIQNKGMSSFTQHVAGLYNNSNKTNYAINLQQYKRADLISSGVRAVLGATSGSNPYIELGQCITNGKVTGESTDSTRAYAAQDSSGNWSFGLGNPPKDSKVGFGGGIPIIINGELYGEQETEEIKHAEGYWLQNDKSVGKVIIGHNSTNNTMMIAVSPDELTEGGMTLDEIRDMLMSQGYDNVLGFDGGSSSTLIRNGDEVIVKPVKIKDNTIPTGLKIEEE